MGAFSRRFTAALIAGAGCACAAPVIAQIPTFSVEGRVGAAVPVSDFADEGVGFEGAAQTDVSFSLGFALQMRDHFGVYAGFGEQRFECVSPACARPSTLVSTGSQIS